MNKEELINTSKRMVVEYYNRYVQNVETDMSEIKINVNNVMLLNENTNKNGDIHLILRVDIDPWLNYNVVYNHINNNLESYIELR